MTYNLQQIILTKHTHAHFDLKILSVQPFNHNVCLIFYQHSHNNLTL